MPVCMIGMFFAGVGITLFFFPNVVRRYDTRMTLSIKDENDYIFSTKVFGIVFFTIGALAIIAALLALAMEAGIFS